MKKIKLSLAAIALMLSVGAAFATHKVEQSSAGALCWTQPNQGGTSFDSDLCDRVPDVTCCYLSDNTEIKKSE